MRDERAERDVSAEAGGAVNDAPSCNRYPDSQNGHELDQQRPPSGQPGHFTSVTPLCT